MGLPCDGMSVRMSSFSTAASGGRIPGLQMEGAGAGEEGGCGATHLPDDLSLWRGQLSAVTL